MTFGTARDLSSQVASIQWPVTGMIEGSGLGLAISRHAIIANGGTIFARNSEQGGLTVTIELLLTVRAGPCFR
jgi:signal transduction histidine kinase